jgi:hypothetical protein
LPSRLALPSASSSPFPYVPQHGLLGPMANKIAYMPQIVGVRVLLWILSLFVDMNHTQLDETVVNGLHFLEHSVLQVPFFLMTLMRYVTPTLDRMYAIFTLCSTLANPISAGSWTPFVG